MRVITIPVKSLDRSKSRLATILSTEERARLTMAMFETVLDASVAQPEWEVWVISRDETVLDFAAERGVATIRERGSTLLDAIEQVERDAQRHHSTELAVVLADLPFATAAALASTLATPEAVTAAPSISDGGTNVLVRRPPSAIPSRFGSSSFAKHRAEAYRRGLTFRSIEHETLAFDLDRAKDLQAIIENQAETRTKAVCLEMGLADRLRLEIQS